MRFLLVDRTVDVDVMRRIETSKRVCGLEDVFADHFPGYLVLEAVAMVGSRRAATAVLEYTLEPAEQEMDAGRHAERLRALAPALRQAPVATRARGGA